MNFLGLLMREYVGLAKGAKATHIFVKLIKQGLMAAL